MQIDTTQVKSFFDRLAPTWDSTREANTAAIRRILDAADIVPGVTVLDVACGTGVLFPFYLERQARHITGVDLSEEMIRVAAGKFQDERVTLLAQDVEQLPPGQYDRIVIFNAFPHFPDPRRLLSALAGHLGPCGRGQWSAATPSTATISSRPARYPWVCRRRRRWRSCSLKDSM